MFPKSVFTSDSLHLWNFQVGPRLDQFSLNSYWYLYFVNSSNNSNLKTRLATFILGSIWDTMDEPRVLCSLYLCSVLFHVLGKSMLMLSVYWEWKGSGVIRKKWAENFQLHLGTFLGQSRVERLFVVVWKVEGRLSVNHASLTSE